MLSEEQKNSHRLLMESQQFQYQAMRLARRIDLSVVVSILLANHKHL
jgi:hypothetical protein